MVLHSPVLPRFSQPDRGMGPLHQVPVQGPRRKGQEVFQHPLANTSDQLPLGQLLPPHSLFSLGCGHSTLPLPSRVPNESQQFKQPNGDFSVHVSGSRYSPLSGSRGPWPGLTHSPDPSPVGCSVPEAAIWHPPYRQPLLHSPPA